MSGARGRDGRALVDPVAIFLLAFGLRLGVVLLSRGGPEGIFGYDAGVYYAAADAFVHGRLPYADFVLLHPPGVMLAVTPFALLGRVTTDHTGFIVANTAFELIGAANAVLVWLIARRMGCRRPAALAGGLFYAVWLGAINAEISVRLEPLSSCAFLLALLALSGSGRLGRRHAALAGLALAAACSIKIWWIVPAAVVLAWLLRDRRRRSSVGWLLGGAALLALVVDVPFLAAAPGTMWRMVVTEQLDRPAISPPVRRIEELTGLRTAFPAFHGVGAGVALVAIVGIVVAVGVAAWQLRTSRMVVVVLIAQLLVLAGSPSYFPFYAGYLAAALALVVAAGAEARAGRRQWPGPAAAWAAALTAAAFTGVALARPITLVAPFPAEQLQGAARPVRCLISDSPAALIQLNALSRGLANGCPNCIDVTGRSYDLDATDESRARNPQWQRELRRYLFSGDAVIVVRPATGYSPATRRALARHPVLGAAGGYVIRAVR